MMLAKSAAVVAASTTLATVLLAGAAEMVEETVPMIDSNLLATSGLGGVGIWAVAVGWAAYRKWTTLVDAQLSYYAAETKHREDSGEHRELHRDHWRRVESALLDLRHRRAADG